MKMAATFFSVIESVSRFSLFISPGSVKFNNKNPIQVIQFDSALQVCTQGYFNYFIFLLILSI